MSILQHNQNALLAKKGFPCYLQLGSDTCVKLLSPLESEWLHVQSRNVLFGYTGTELGIARIVRLGNVENEGYSFITESQWNAMLGVSDYQLMRA